MHARTPHTHSHTLTHTHTHSHTLTHTHTHSHTLTHTHTHSHTLTHTHTHSHTLTHTHTHSHTHILTRSQIQNVARTEITRLEKHLQVLLRGGFSLHRTHIPQHTIPRTPPQP